jgi:hypothetical protein
MNTQTQHFYNTQEFRIGVIGLLAVVALAAGAFWFGTGLQAETSPSVAPSPLGSSLTAVRESQAVARSPLGSSLTAVRESQAVARSPLGSSLTAVRNSQSLDYVDRLSSAYAANTSASSQPLDYVDRLSNAYPGR